MAKIENFLQLIKENPDAEIIPIVSEDVVADDSYNYWYGSWGNCYLDEICTDVEFSCYEDDRFFLKSDDSLYEFLYDRHADDEEYEAMSPEEYEEEIRRMVDSHNWKKCIVVYINGI